MPEVPPELRDFRNFLFLVWCHLNLPEPTPVQYDIARYLQKGPRRCVIQAFRGVGKSWITVAYVLWRLLLNPQEKILVVSASKNLADNFTTFCFQLLSTMPQLAHLQPRDDQRNSKVQFDVGPALESKDPSVRSVGITGQITGGRADLIIADDIESANNALTQLSRDRLAEAIKEFDAVLKPGGSIKYLGTPQTEMSIYNVLPARGYEIRIWPARHPDEKLRQRYGSKLAPQFTGAYLKDPTIVGHPTDPKRFSDLDLCEREASYGRSGFALQFQLDTSLADQDRYPLKLSDLIVADVNIDLAPERIVWASSPTLAWGDDVPCVGFTGDRYYRPMSIVGDWIPYTGSVLAIDPAGRGSDELGYAIVKMLNGTLYVPAAGGRKGGYAPENLEFLAKLAKTHKVNAVVYETNFGDGMFGELFKPVLAREWECSVEEVRHSTQKEKRIIDTLEPVLNQHRLVVDPKVIRQDFESVSEYPNDTRQSFLLFHQLSRITKDRGALRHDDRLDALSIGVNYWTTAMAQDDKKKVQERKEDKLKAELERFMQTALGRPQKSKGWIQPHRN
jgi:hypothetical protein